MYEKNRILKIKKDTPLQKNKKQNKNKPSKIATFTKTNGWRFYILYYHNCINNRVISIIVDTWKHINL